MQVGNLEAARDFLDVRDVCRAYISIIANSKSLPRETILNVSSGKGHRIIDLLTILKSYSNREFGIELDRTRLRPSDIPSSIGIARALNDLSGWEPEHKIADTLKDILEYERGR